MSEADARNEALTQRLQSIVHEAQNYGDRLIQEREERDKQVRAAFEQMIEENRKRGAEHAPPRADSAGPELITLDMDDE